MVQPRPTLGERGDGGFTLIELMASLTLIAVGVVGVIGVMNSSFRVVGTASSRSKATAVATKWIEELRSKPYDVVLLEAQDADGTVTTPPPELVGGQSFDVTYALDEVNETTTAADGTTKTDAYVSAVVWVDWTDASGPHDLYQSTLIYPGGRGLHDAAEVVSSDSSSTKPLKPKSLTATPVSGTSSVDLEWVPPDVTIGVPNPAEWIVQYSRSSSFLPGEVQQIAAHIPGSVTTLRVTDLAEGTTYHFRVYAKSESGVLSQEAATALNVMTGTSGVASCAVGTASVTPSAVKKKGGAEAGRLSVSPTVEVQLLTTCTGSTFAIEYSPQDGDVRTAMMAAVAERPGTLTATINKDLNWTVGDRPVDVYSYTDGVKKLRANLRLIVCDHNKAMCP